MSSDSCRRRWDCFALVLLLIGPSAIMKAAWADDAGAGHAREWMKAHQPEWAARFEKATEAKQVACAAVSNGSLAEDTGKGSERGERRARWLDARIACARARLAWFTVLREYGLFARSEAIKKGLKAETIAELDAKNAEDEASVARAAAELGRLESEQRAPSEGSELPAMPRQTCVLDEVGVLDETEQRELRETCHRNWHGRSAQVAVVITRDLRGLTLKEFGTRLSNKWGLGDRERDDGVLIVMHIQPERSQLRVAVGRGLEGVLTDSDLKRMMKRHQPKEHDSKPGPGLRALSESLGIAVHEAVMQGRLEGHAAAKRAARESKP